MDGKIKNKFGYCEYSFESDYVHIYNLFTYPKFRQKGKAKLNLKLAIAAIRKTGYDGNIQIVANPKSKFVNVDRLRLFYESLNLEVFNYYG